MGRPEDAFDCISAIDFRYWDREAASYLSENAFTKYKAKVEMALVRVLHSREMCSEEVVSLVEQSCKYVTTAEVYAEEDIIHHDLRALVNRILWPLPDFAKPYVHFSATSYDVVDTANACRYRDVVLNLFLPALIELEMTLIQLARREAETLQIGRTHGQHAVPVTFGFAIAGYVDRIGRSIKEIEKRAQELPGKFSGAVGAYNASAFFFDDPVQFEIDVLGELGLKPLLHSTQVVQPEPLIRLVDEAVLAAGILADLADDMRHLQRTEIGEVGEEFKNEQVGSSTMPQKRNPINFENVKSIWKKLQGMLVTVRLDQLSEHQRDLTNSASGRSVVEIFAYVYEMTKRLNKVMAKLKVDKANMAKNLAMSQGKVLAEPMQLILAALSHPNAHEAVKQLTLASDRSGRPLAELFEEAEDMAIYRERLTEKQRIVLLDPNAYVGIAVERAYFIAQMWEQSL